MDVQITDIVIDQTKRWIEKVVIGCNFCPFAAKPFNHDGISYVVSETESFEVALQQVMKVFYSMDDQAQVETALLIFSKGFSTFDEYLELVDLAEELLNDQEYEGVYQLASFHPQYCFADSEEGDPANYTNRSVYPMLHFLREESVEDALAKYKNPELIPERNIEFARLKGLAYMEKLRRDCL